MKYIIEIPEQIAEASADYMKKVGMSIEPYTEPDRKAVENAQEEAWGLAKKIALTGPSGGLTINEIKDCYGSDKAFADDVFKDFSYQEAKTKYDDWKAKREQIHVGDELEAEPGNKACVLYENPDRTQVFVFKADGTAAWWSKCAIHKTGRHFSEVAELLKKMKE